MEYFENYFLNQNYDIIKWNKKKHKDGKILIKGHKFVDIKYRMPTWCDACNKPLWDLFNPPAAIECLCIFLIIIFIKLYELKLSISNLKLHKSLSYKNSSRALYK